MFDDLLEELLIAINFNLLIIIGIAQQLDHFHILL